MHVEAEGLTATEREPLGSRKAVRGVPATTRSPISNTAVVSDMMQCQRRSRTKTLTHTKVNTGPVKQELAVVGTPQNPPSRTPRAARGLERHNGGRSTTTTRATRCKGGAQRRGALRDAGGKSVTRRVENETIRVWCRRRTSSHASSGGD